MNWSRGTLRLWIVISIIWVISVIFYYDTINNIIDPIEAHKFEQEKTEAARKAGYTDIEITQYLRKTSIIETLEYGFIPPVFLLLAGLTARWILRGFIR